MLELIAFIVAWLDTVPNMLLCTAYLWHMLPIFLVQSILHTILTQNTRCKKVHHWIILYYLFKPKNTFSDTMMCNVHRKCLSHQNVKK